MSVQQRTNPQQQQQPGQPVMDETTRFSGQDGGNSLRLQNDQLWKLIEKQKLVINNLQKDNQRLTQERDKLISILKEVDGDLIASVKGSNSRDSVVSNGVINGDQKQLDNNQRSAVPAVTSSIDAQSGTNSNNINSISKQQHSSPPSQSLKSQQQSVEHSNYTNEPILLVPVDNHQSSETNASSPEPSNEAPTIPRKSDRRKSSTPSLNSRPNAPEKDASSTSQNSQDLPSLQLAGFSQSPQTSPKQNPPSPATSVKSSGSGSTSSGGGHHKRSETNDTDADDLELIMQFPAPASAQKDSSTKKSPPTKLSQLPPRKNSNDEASKSTLSPRLAAPPTLGLPSSPRSGLPPGIIKSLGIEEEIEDQQTPPPRRSSEDTISSPEQGLPGATVNDQVNSETYKNSSHKKLSTTENQPVEKQHIGVHSVSQSLPVNEIPKNERGANTSTAAIRETHQKHGHSGSLTHINSEPNLTAFLAVASDKLPKHHKSYESVTQVTQAQQLPVTPPSQKPVLTYPSNPDSLGVPAIRKNRNSAVIMKSTSLPLEGPALTTEERGHQRNKPSITDSNLSVVTSTEIISPPELTTTSSPQPQSAPPAYPTLLQIPPQQQQQQQPSHSENPTLSSEAISGITVKVIGSNIKNNEKGKEVLAFVISVGRAKLSDKPVAMDEELWRVEKLYSDFLALDVKLKQQQSRSVKIGKLPDKNLFTNHAPSKVDQRKLALENYLQHVISLPLKDPKDLCEFLSTDAIEREENYQQNIAGYKEGYLTKRGKNFGGWKTRYFVLKSPVLQYYESKDGHQLGSIRLTDAQIGRQQNTSQLDADPSSENSYRHAFLIMEPKIGSKGSTRHVLCAESDAQRDEWVDALLQYVNVSEEEYREVKKQKKEKAKKLATQNIEKINAQPISQLGRDESNYKLIVSEAVLQQARDEIRQESQHPESRKKGNNDSISSKENLIGIGYDSMSTGPAPVGSYTPTHHISSSLSSNHSFSSQTTLSNSLPANLSPLQQDPSFSQQRLGVSNQANKRGSMLMIREDPEMPLKRAGTPEQKEPIASQNNTGNLHPLFNPPINGQGQMLRRTDDHEKRDRKGVRMTFFGRQMFGGNREEKKREVALDPSRIVFGVPLDQAISVARIKEGYELPAVVYRCIEYLDSKNAAFEEGIYRLSGSSATIKLLRDRFNTEGDVDLLGEGEYYDVHAVAGLLKMYLRELPNSVLTRELHMEFVNVIDLLDRRDRVNELGRLVSALPLANYTLLRTLTGHLIRVVQNADINKMTIRNIGIVFSPTLGIPAGVFSLLMAEFEYIFFIDGDGVAAPKSIEETPEEKEQRLKRGQESEEAQNVQDSDQDVDTAQGIALSPNAALRRRDLRDEITGRSNRNSVHYVDNAPESLVGLERKTTVKSLAQNDGDDDDDDDDDDEMINDLELQAEDDDSESKSSHSDEFAPSIQASSTPHSQPPSPTTLRTTGSASTNSSRHSPSKQVPRFAEQEYMVQEGHDN